MPCSVQSPAHRSVSMSRACRLRAPRLIGERCLFIAARLPIRRARTHLYAMAVNAPAGRGVLLVLSSCLEASDESPAAAVVDVRDHLARAVRVHAGPAGGGDRA